MVLIGFNDLLLDCFHFSFQLVIRFYLASLLVKCLVSDD